MSKDKSIVSKEQLILAIAELLLVAVVATVAYFTTSESVVSPIIGFVGTLLVINRAFNNYQTESIVQPTETRVDKIGEIIDLDDDVDHATISELYKTYLGIQEAEFRNLKDNIVNSALSELRNLKNNKQTNELTTAEYYGWLLDRLDEVDSSGSIKAVSAMNDAEWDESEEEKKFVQKNLDAASKGAPVERVFIMTQEVKSEALKNIPIQHHLKDSGKGLIGYHADKEQLKLKNKSLLKAAGEGFIIINSRVALIDRFDIDGGVRGIVTMDEQQIKKLERIFEQLKKSSSRLIETSEDVLNLK